MSKLRTEHKIYYSDARSMKEIPNESVDLMITSPLPNDTNVG